MLDNLKHFNTDEILAWLTEAKLFFIRPHFVINQIKKKNPDELQRQFFFFFTTYGFSYLFLSLGTTIDEWLKPALINLLTLIPTGITFYLSTKPFKKKYLFETVIYFLSVHFLLTPIAILVYATFLSSENYTYKFMVDILTGLGAVYLVIMFGFAIESNKRVALKISATTYLVINLIYFLFTRIDIDEYGVAPFSEFDPIYYEYCDMVVPLKNKEVIPTTRTILVYSNNIFVTFGTQDIITSQTSKGSAKENRLYRNSIENNIKHIEKTQPKLKFQRNKEFADVWLEYFSEIKEELEFTVRDTFEIKELGLKQLDSAYFNRLGIKTYLMGTEIGKLIQNQIPLKWYHNSTISNHQTSVAIAETKQLAVFLIGHLLDVLVSDIILDEDAPRPMNDKFIEPE